MLRSLLIATFCFAALPTASADVARYRCTGPTTGPIRIISDGNTCRGFVAGTKQHLFSRMASGTVLASKDGKTVILVEDYLPGTVDTKRKVVTTNIDSEAIDNPTVLQIWRDGVRVAFYDIARLAGDVTTLQRSISHVRWIAELPTDLDGARFSIVTTSNRRITFDTKTGKIVDEQDVAAKRP